MTLGEDSFLHTQSVVFKVIHLFPVWLLLPEVELFENVVRVMCEWVNKRPMQSLWGAEQCWIMLCSAVHLLFMLECLWCHSTFIVQRKIKMLKITGYCH